MASCDDDDDDDDFTLLGDDNQTPPPHHHPHLHHHHHHHHHHQNPLNPHPHPHQSFTPHRFVAAAAAAAAAAAKPTPIHPLPQAQLQQHPPSYPLNNLGPTSAAAAGGGSPKKLAGDEDDADAYSEAAFCEPKCPPPFHDVNPNCFAPEDDANPFAATEDETDPNKSRPGNVRIEKRKDRDELSDGGTPYGYKKSKAGGGSVTVISGGGDYRKDREEWSDTAIGCLLDAYTDKFIQLNRGNLRGRDWEEVSSIVSDRCDKQKSHKSVEQCKNKVDNLKKRYKVERNRVTSGGGTVTASHWPWFKKMEQIVGNSASSRAMSDEDKSMGASSSMLRQNKRYGISTPSPGSLPNNMKSKSLANPRWRRVVFKISGAALAGTGPQNIDPKVTVLIAREVAMASRLGVEVAVVVGGRNFFCGDTWVAATGLERSTAYQIGMMATVMNSILLQSALEKMGVQTRVQTAFQIPEVAEPYSRKRAVRHLEKGRVVIFGGIGAGMGNPLFTTDTAAALRASEINAEALLKGTIVEDVYDSRNNTNNMTFEHLSFQEFVSKGVSSMDMMAVTFCEENGIPVMVFDLNEPGNISRALCGDQVGTLIDQAGRIS